MTDRRLPLSARLRAIVQVQCSSVAPFTCSFEPGGRLHGVGIPSPLYCARCGHAATWHTVAEAALLAEQLEQSERLPFVPGPEHMRRTSDVDAEC